MLAIWIYPILCTFIIPVSTNILFLPRGQIYASYNHWNLHLPIETRASWKFAEKLDHHIKVFKSQFNSRFAEYRQELRSDLTQRLWGKFMRDTDLLDREMNLTIDALEHINVLKYRTSRHYNAVTIPVVSVTTVALLVACVLFILKCTRCTTVTVSLFRSEPSRPNPTHTGLTVDGSTTDQLTTDRPTPALSTDTARPDKAQVTTAPPLSSLQCTSGLGHC